jgi:hypothetical protein
MIISSGSKTRMFGNPIKVAEDFINITNAIRQGFTNRYDQQTADELIVDCVRLIMLADTDRKNEAEKDLAKVLMSIAET